jgi:hypothetical protein
VRRLIPVLLALLAACGGNSYSIPKPDPLPSLPATTSAADFSNVQLAAVPGRTTTTIVLGPGGATLEGAVTAPDGLLVPGATVHIERLVGDSVASADVVSGPDGRWAAPRILGGRYRVRAWRVPDLALTKPVVFFLGATEHKKAVDLPLTQYTGIAVSASVAPNPPQVDDPINLVVRVAQQSVENNGVVRAAPIGNLPVELVGSGDWRVDSENPTVTDFNGDAFWQVRCRSSGSQPLAVLINNEALPLTIPACQSAFVEEQPDGTGLTTIPPTTVRRTTTTGPRRTTTTG